MGFGNGSWAKIWNVEDKGNYHVVELSTSKKNKEGQYETDFSSKFVRFIGTAHQQAMDLKKGDRIKLGNCDVTAKYDKDKQKEFVNYCVFSFDVEAMEKPTAKDGAKPSKAKGTSKSVTPVDDDELPFN